jgi:antitoxin component YwqK of YwqJK toxin-antitoxin module
MPVHVIVLDDQSSYNGLMQGNCEYYDTDKMLVMKGNFINSILTDLSNILINYTDMSFRYYYGHFKNNKPDGNMIIYNFNGNGEPIDQIIGIINVEKLNCIYSNGQLISTINKQNIEVSINIEYKNIDETILMTKFDLLEI